MSVHRPHLPQRPACPFLPVVEAPLTYHAMRALGRERGALFYETALRYAASLWLQGLPARSLLLINRALSADLEGNEEVLARHPLPYRAVGWVLENRPQAVFIGNPRRHYQHLATRMTPPRKEQRTWRAWACWYLSRLILPEDCYPADELQIVREGVAEPSYADIAHGLRTRGIPGEWTVWNEAVEACA